MAGTIKGPLPCPEQGIEKQKAWQSKKKKKRIKRKKDKRENRRKKRDNTMGIHQ